MVNKIRELTVATTKTRNVGPSTDNKLSRTCVPTIDDTTSIDELVLFVAGTVVARLNGKSNVGTLTIVHEIEALCVDLDGLDTRAECGAGKWATAREGGRKPERWR